MMTPRAALLLAWSIFAALVVAVVMGLAAMAHSADAPQQVPIANFICREGVCVTTEAEFERMQQLWYLLQQRMIECAERRI